METSIDTISINGKEYVAKPSLGQTAADPLEGMKYVIVRTYSAGVHAGYLKERNGQEVTLKKARRIWQWTGAASLSQLAQSGTSNPGGCKFPEEVDSIILLQAVEILDVTAVAKKIIDSVAVWKN